MAYGIRLSSFAFSTSLAVIRVISFSNPADSYLSVEYVMRNLLFLSSPLHKKTLLKDPKTLSISPDEIISFPKLLDLIHLNNLANWVLINKNITEYRSSVRRSIFITCLFLCLCPFLCQLYYQTCEFVMRCYL